MNKFKKYCPNVWVAECEEEYKKGDILKIRLFGFITIGIVRVIKPLRYNNEFEVENHKGKVTIQKLNTYNSITYKLKKK